MTMAVLSHNDTYMNMADKHKCTRMSPLLIGVTKEDGMYKRNQTLDILKYIKYSLIETIT